MIKPGMSDGWSACLQTLEGHSGCVSSVAFSHDSAKLASASSDGTVKIWDEGHSSSVSSADVVSILASLHSETVTKPQQPVRQGTAISLDSTWISDDAQNLLWLPT